MSCPSCLLLKKKTGGIGKYQRHDLDCSRKILGMFIGTFLPAYLQLNKKKTRERTDHIEGLWRIQFGCIRRGGQGAKH